MDNYFFPQDLFPSKDQIKKLLTFTQKDEQFVGASETSKYDKELSRFIRSSIDWGMVHRGSTRSGNYKDLGFGSWLADYDALPFEVQQIEEKMGTQPDSIANFVTKTFTQKQVLYCAHSGEFVLPQREHQSDEFVSELLFIVVKKGQNVHLKDSLNLAGIKARMIFGFIEPDATLSYTAHEDYGSGYGLFQEHWTLDARSTLKSITVMQGGKQTWALKEYALQEDASVEQITVAAFTASEQSALVTRQFHLDKSSKSSVYVKTALKESAQAFYRGTISIQEKATGSLANQQHTSLILDPTARSCGIPSLEVATDNVSCRHGSAAGHFNEHERSYLLSRGFDKKQAEKLLLQAFYRDVLPHESESAVIHSLLHHMNAL